MTLLAGYALGLAVVFAAAFGLGRAIGPVGVVSDNPTHQMPMQNTSVSP